MGVSILWLVPTKRPRRLVLSKFSTGQNLKLTLTVEVAPPGGVTPQTVEDTKVALRELGLSDNVEEK